MRTLLDENKIVILDHIWNIVENKLFLTFNLISMLETKNCIVLQKTTTTEPTQTKPHAFFLRFRWLLA